MVFIAIQKVSVWRSYLPFPISFARSTSWRDSLGFGPHTLTILGGFLTDFFPWSPRRPMDPRAAKITGSLTPQSGWAAWAPVDWTRKNRPSVLNQPTSNLVDMQQKRHHLFNILEGGGTDYGAIHLHRRLMRTQCRIWPNKKRKGSMNNSPIPYA